MGADPNGANLSKFPLFGIAQAMLAPLKAGAWLQHSKVANTVKLVPFGADPSFYPSFSLGERISG